MRLNADFSKRAMVICREASWLRSPESGVDRLLLDRVGDEVARATSVVRYAAGSSFPPHEHARGEEFLVLDGVFSDDTGDYPRGSYVRNPPGTGHAPYSRQGCRILVKLRQFDPEDRTPVVIDTTSPAAWQESAGSNLQILHLHEYRQEKVAMLRLPRGARLPADARGGGLECFVVAGRLRVDDTDLPAEAWLRLPAGDPVAVSAVEDSRVWLKTGHLRERDGM